MARPTKYTPERVKRILDALRGGCSRRDAYEYGGIDSETFSRWLLRFADFAEQVRDAESSAAVMHTANIARAAKDGDWKASLEWLKRRRREEWGDSVKTEVSGPNGGPVKTEDVSLSDEERIMRLAALFDSARARRSGQADSLSGTDGDTKT